MKYETVEKQFHILDSVAFAKWFKKRYESDSTVHFNLSINKDPAFFHYEIPLFNKVVEISQKNDRLNSLFAELPGIASKQYIRNSLVIDVKKTNEIEGVFSSRKEIFELTEDLKKRKSDRIGSIVNKYLLLLNKDGEEKFSSCENIRKTYDEMFFSGDKPLLDPDLVPDGVLFRKNYVGVYDDGNEEPVHKGVLPESTIISYLDEGIRILNDEEMNPFIRAALFHYIFEYVHPFYDGNGRVGRYIVSSFVKNNISPILAFRISTGITDHKSKYYKAFKMAESPLNKGDLTVFVYEFLDILEKTYDESIKYASEKKVILEDEYKYYKEVFPHLSKSEDSILYMLVQASVFSDFGVTIKDIEENLGVSVRTIRRCIETLKEKNVLNEQKYSKAIYYTLREAEEKHEDRTV